MAIQNRARPGHAVYDYYYGGQTMPAAVAVPAAITGGAAIVGSMFNRSASNRATEATRQGNMQAQRFAREQEAERTRQWNIDQTNKKRQWDADEEQREYDRIQNDLLLSQRLEDRAFAQEDRDYYRGLETARETRREPYRKASLDALGRLGGLMSSGGQWRSPSNVGRGTLGAVARGT